MGASFIHLKADHRNRLFNNFEEAGFVVEKFDIKEMKKKGTYQDWHDPSDEKYPPYPQYNNFYREPIILKDALTNDLYALYGDRDINFYPYYTFVEDSFIRQENGIWELNPNSKNINSFIFSLIEKGKTFDVRGTQIERGEEAINELATLENFDLDAPNYNDIYAQDPTISVATPEFDIDELKASQIELGEELLQKSIDNLKELQNAKELGTLDSAMWSVEEVDKMYNTHISTDDKRAFLIWLQNKNQKKLEGEFAKKYATDLLTPAEVIIELMRKAKLFYVENAPPNERLQPKVIFQSGNIWRKMADLKDLHLKEKFIARFGEEIHSHHLKVLEPIWKDVWAKRLKLAPEDKGMRLHMLPISEMAMEVKVEKFVSVKDRDAIKKNFTIYASFKKGETEFDLERESWQDEKASNNYVTKKYITLQTAFLLWCKDAGSGEVSANYGVKWSSKTKNWKDLQNAYIKPTKNPYTADKKMGAEKWAREKDDARKVGNRLFALFLEQGLDPKDQNRIEIIWNSTFNYYREPILEEVPIGFTYKKYIDNIHLFTLREANLNALRYYMSRGNVGLAYGVGIGKTFCAIFVIKQALDLGLAKRPLIAVPNQVYFQFSQEIQRGLGQTFNPLSENSRLNMFYNGKGQYNAMGNNAVDGINLCTYEALLNFEFVKEKIYDEKNDIITADWVEQGVKVLLQGSETLNAPKLISETLKSNKKTLFNEFEVDIDKSKKDEETESVEEDETMVEDRDYEEMAEGGKAKEIEPIFINSDTTDYDMIVIDEAHNFNHLFTKVLSAVRPEQTDKGNINREKNPYSSIRETAGGKEASSRAEKLFWISRYVQSKSRINNTILLSATPFTNSPTQVFSLLTILDYDALKETSVGIMKDFYDLFAKIEYAEDFKTDLRIVKREKLTGWINIIAMQKLIYRCFDKSSREDEEKAVIRPKKIVLPLKRIDADDKIIEMASKNHISTTIKMSRQQEDLWNKIRSYAQGGENAVSYEVLCNDETANTTSYGRYTKKKKKAKEVESDGGTEIDIENADELKDGTKDGEKASGGAKALQCLNWGRALCLNPYLFKCSGYKTEPTPKQYVEASPKLLYVMLCIQSVKEYHEKEGGLMSGQVIYMDFGVKAFPLIRDYLVEELAFDLQEIGIISGKGNYVGKKRYTNKVSVQDFFLGRSLNAETGKYTQIADNKRVKVLIGSQAIREGINLQDYASVLYNCFLDYNPTDNVQLIGRIWRQGNAFANVRIVMPLMADCIDIFMFQKLQDKTERINQIWTKAGNKNELDTTAFNPEELKYELMTDPYAIAQLERENKNDKFDEDITEETEIYSGFLSLENIFTKYNKVVQKEWDAGRIKNNFYISMYWNINQIRPDLIDKPLLNKDGLKAFMKKALKEVGSDISVEEYMDINKLSGVLNALNSDSPLKINNTINTIREENLLSILNYSAKDLIEMMVILNKDQKIAFPRGYSKNWRELKPPLEIPIMEGDKVSYKSKKGRKSGIASFVLNKNEDNIVDVMLSEVIGDYLKSEVFADEGEKFNLEVLNKIIKDSKAKLKAEDLFTEKDERKFYTEWFYAEEGSEKEMVKDLELKEVTKLLKYILNNLAKIDSTYDIKLSKHFLEDNGKVSRILFPNSLDVGDTEDINVESKEVRSEEPKKELKTIKPTKYPDPYRWDSKNRTENLKDSFEYIESMKKKGGGDEYYDQFIVESDETRWDWVTANMNGVLQLFSQNRNMYNLNQANILFNSYGLNYDNIEYHIDQNKTWIELQEKFDEDFGLFMCYNYDFYNHSMPKAIAEFEIAYREKLEPNNLFKVSDVEIKKNESKEKMNAIALEQKNLWEEERFEEIVQEVRRRQQELAEEEIRAGNSFRARATAFATPNPEYLGNDLLSIFETRGTQKAEMPQEVEEAVEVKEVDEETKGIIEGVNNDIEELQGLLELTDDEEIREGINNDIGELQGLLLELV